MSFQLPATTTTGATGGFSFGLATNTTAPSFSFGTTGGGDAGAAKPLAFGVPQQAPVAGLGASAAPVIHAAAATTTSAPQPAGGLGGGGLFSSSVAAVTPIAAVAAPTLTTSVVPTSAQPTLSVSKPSATPTLALGAAATITTSSGGAAVATTTGSAQATGGTAFANLTTATKTTDSVSVANAAHMSYNQLEEHINKWTLELEEQEKVFTDQATQINAWDNILIGNNQKILALNDAVQKVKADQHSLEQELEFIATQHKELEESIVPLQKEFMRVPQVDVERSQTYLLVENLDTQLKQMSEDLKEIIDNLNEATRGQDSTDPIIQIGKILNAHMNSLQWIDASSGNICQRLEEITQMNENIKRDSERSFRSAYYN